jgi:hypothetical protein
MQTNIEIRKSKIESKLQKILFLVCSLFFSVCCNAQCAMCRASLESTGNVEKAKAVNDGIVYLMIIPYILAAGIAYIVYRMYKKGR